MVNERLENCERDEKMHVPAPSETQEQMPRPPEMRAGRIEGRPARETEGGSTKKCAATEMKVESGEGQRPRAFPIVGIGASAGGLEAFEAFFDAMPPDSGMAFVLIQHLAPAHKSHLLELIQRHTQMTVFEAENRVEVQPNCVYVIPPNRDLLLRHRTLYLTPPSMPQGLRLPIDIFFRALAEDQGETAIGIILSGAGSDGTVGLRAIKEAGGMVMAQDPASASHSGMPGSAVATGLTDYVLPPDAMPGALIAYVEHIGHPGKSLAPPAYSHPADAAADAMQEILTLLRLKTGHDFSAYKRTTMARRVTRRMAVRHAQNLGAYVQRLREDEAERRALFRELLIGVTNFFRDPEAFNALNAHAILQILKEREAAPPIRVWVPGCATGEEAYSIAILFQEALEAYGSRAKIQIFATDIDDQAIEKARAGIYPEGIAADVSPARLQRFFENVEGGYKVRDALRKMVVFAVQSVIKDPPFSKLDLVSCRNLLIYLQPDLQNRVMALFYYALRPGGFLFLGTSETPAELSAFFKPVARQWKLFQRTHVPERRVPLPFPARLPLWEDVAAQKSMAEVHSALDARQVIERTLLERYMPPSMIINQASEVLFVYGRTGPYTEPVAGAASLNATRLVREALRVPLSIAIRQAINQGQQCVHRGARVETEEGETQVVNLSVTPLRGADTGLASALQDLLLIQFEQVDVSTRAPVPSPEGNAMVDRDLREADQLDLERELQATREYLQTTVEELQSANEEVKSTNEELQSANEELETSQEELQSVNEELATLNTELESKVEALTWANDDLHNLLSSIDVGIIFLDRHMHVRRFNQAATQVVNLIETDIGRPIDHIVSRLAHGEWKARARTVFETLIPQAQEIQNKDGSWHLVRIRPYRTGNNAIEGVVLTFTDITEQKEAYELVQNIVHTMREPLLVLDADLRVTLANRAFCETFEVTRAATEGQRIYDLGDRQWDIPELRELLEDVIPTRSTFENFEVTHDFPGMGVRTMRLNARQVRSAGGTRPLILLAFESDWASLP